MLKDAINAPISNTTAAKNILSKINFPKEALIISGLYKLLFNSSVKIILLLVFLVVYGVGLQPSLVFLPLVILGILVFGTAIGLLITPIGMLYKDVARMINMGLNLIMYITPVVFAIPKESGLMQTLMQYNPLTPLVMTVKDVAFGTEPLYLTYFVILMTCSIPVFCVGLLFYRISIPIIVERLSA
jgi:lipopolysaccharide transport system permease protein